MLKFFRLRNGIELLYFEVTCLKNSILNAIGYHSIRIGNRLVANVLARAVVDLPVGSFDDAEHALQIARSDSGLFLP